MQLPPGLDHHAYGFAIETARLSGRLVLLAAIFAPLEHFFSAHEAKLFHRGWATNLSWYFLNALTPVLLLAPLAALLAQAVHAVLPTALTTAGAALPFWARALASLVVGEFGYYWAHRLSHEIPFLWRFHAVHHSAEHVNFMVNNRAHPLDLVFSRLGMLIPLYATGLAAPLGAGDSIPALVLVFGLTWSYFIHANVRWRLGWLEHVISTPAFHHWHHTRDDHIDHNYATMLPFMDRLFGTFYLPRHLPAAYGIDGPMPRGVLGQLAHPFAPARATQS